mmetsp:Transcript_12266/g.21731  ORF Transcript_12266/g.21731 Transcript_12266/m.21731 type:complete len:217 (-) Transcript_12266:317-967(-)
MGGFGAAKYRQAVPTPGWPLEGAGSSAGPNRRAASGPSTATTTPRRAVRVRGPEGEVTVTRAGLSPTAASTLTTCVFSDMWSAGSFSAICCATSPIPLEGRQLEPVASMRMTNSNSLDDVPRLRSKKMPPKKGLKKREIMASEKPSACSFCLMVVSGRDIISSKVPSRHLNLKMPTRILSNTLPTGLVRLKMPSTGCLNGSATRCQPPCQRTSAPE